MKINEFSEKIDEIGLSNVIGSQVGTRIQSAESTLNPLSRQGSMSVQDRRVINDFTKKFIATIANDLSRGIKAGIINPQNTISATPTATSKAAPNSTTATPSVNSGSTVPAGETPEQKRIRLQKAAQQNINKTATPAAVPTAPTKMTPQQIAALKGRIKAGTTATSAQSGFKNYVGGSGERMTGVDKSGAPIFQKIQRENKFLQLNTIFESILSIDEASTSYPDTISSYIVDYIKNYTQGLNTAKYDAKIKQLADQIEMDYNSMNPMKRGGKKALENLANITYFIAKGPKATADTSIAAPTPTTTPSSAGTDASAQPTTTPAVSTKIVQAMQALQKTNPREFNTLLKSLKPLVDKLPK